MLFEIDRWTYDYADLGPFTPLALDYNLKKLANLIYEDYVPPDIRAANAKFPLQYVRLPEDAFLFAGLLLLISVCLGVVLYDNCCRPPDPELNENEAVADMVAREQEDLSQYYIH